MKKPKWKRTVLTVLCVLAAAVALVYFYLFLTR